MTHQITIVALKIGKIGTSKDLFLHRVLTAGPLLPLQIRLHYFLIPLNGPKGLKEKSSSPRTEPRRPKMSLLKGLDSKGSAITLSQKSDR